MSNASTKHLPAPDTAVEPAPALALETPKKTVESLPWNPWLGVVFIVAVFYLSQIIGGLLVSIYPLLRHWNQVRANEWLTNSVIGQFSYVLIAESVVIGSVYLFLKHYKVGFKVLGLRRLRWSDPLYALAAAPFYYVAAIITIDVISRLIPALNVNQQQDIGFTSVHGLAQLVLTFISLVILPPIAEELMMRGFLFGSLRKLMPTIAAGLVTSFIFASAHLPEGGAAGPLYIAAIQTFVLSLFLVGLRIKTKGLYASMTLHAINNGLAFVSLFLLHSR